MSEPSERRRQTDLAKKPVRRVFAPLAGVGIAAFPVGFAFSSLFAASRPNFFSLASDPALVAGLWVLLVVIIALDAIFVAGEFAIDLLKSSHIGERDTENEQQLLQRQYDRKESVVAACVLGAYTMRALIIFTCIGLSPSVGRSLGWLPEDAPLGEALSVVFGITVGLSIPVMFINVVIEVVGKAYALSYPAEASLRLSKVLRFFDIVFRPLAKLATAMGGIVTKRFGTDATFSTDVSKAEEEIKEILDSSEQTGEIDDSERALLQSVFDFGDTICRSIMTPRVDIEAIRAETDLDSVAKLVEATGFSRFPVYEETDDQIIGIIHAKDVLKSIARGHHPDNLRDLIRPAHFVPETKTLHDLLTEMRLQQTQMAIVQDEMGGTSGLVTIEDIVEELVGEIIDEYDIASPEIVTHGEKHLVSGKFALDDLNQTMGSSFESEEFDSVGGYVFGLFGRQPRIGEWLDHEGYRFTIVESDGRRIHRLSIEPVAEEEEATTASV